MERIEELTAPPVFGRFYLVPTVRYTWQNMFGEWPVMGPKHTDVEHFNFRWQHYHIDPRFLTARQWRYADLAYSSRSALEALQGAPLSQGDWDGKQTGVPHPAPMWRRRKCTLPGITWMWPEQAAVLSLKKAHAGQEAPLVNGIRICPHRGAPLSSLAPDRDGCVTCPLHGLRFDKDWRALEANP